MTRWTLAERKRQAARLPWVTLLKRPTERCDGIKWGSVALKDLYPRGGKPARGIQEKSKCQHRGWWRFNALKSDNRIGLAGTSGVYCWTHLTMQLGDHEAERARYTKWLDAHPETTEEDL